MRPGDIAIVGAAESTEIGTVPNVSSTGLALDGAVNALEDAGLTAKDIDGITTGYFPVADISRQLGIFPKWCDNTIVGPSPRETTRMVPPSWLATSNDSSKRSTRSRTAIGSGLRSAVPTIARCTP